MWTIDRFQGKMGFCLVLFTIYLIYSVPVLYGRWLANVAYVEYVKGLAKAERKKDESINRVSFYDTYEKAVGVYPSLSESSFYQARLLWQDQVMRVPSLPALCPSDSDRHVLLLLFRQVQYYISQQQYEAAERLIRWLNNNCPDSFDTMEIWSDLKKAQGDYDGAIMLRLEAMSMKPWIPPREYRHGGTPISLWGQISLADNMEKIGFLYQKKMNYRKASQFLIESLNLSPPGYKNPWTYNAIGILSYEVGDIDEAKWAFENAIKLNPQLPEARGFLKKINSVK